MSELTRRAFLGRSAGSLGALALSRLLGGDEAAVPHFAPKAKRVVYLFQSGGPSHIDLFDYKPVMRELHGEELPESVRGGQRVTGMTAGQKSFPVLAPPFEFAQHGESGAWVSELMPWTARIADRLCFLKGVHTEAINHDPAITTINTGAMQPGKASLGSWLSYGLGSENRDLPAYLVLLSQGTGKDPGQPLFSRLWGSGFLPPSHQGVQLRPGANPVLYLQNPPGVDPSTRRALLDDLARLNGEHADATGDPEARTRIDQYEMAFRMQTSVPELTDLSKEPESTFELYGEDARKPGTYAYNALMARKLSEEGVRFVQLFHRGWDTHGNLPGQLRARCKETDQASTALIKDLKMRGLFDETLVVWGGEFGRTVYCQGNLSEKSYGRDHHPRCFSIWMAGGGIKGGTTYGATDDYGYNIVENPVSVHDLHAT
ncbi:MAG: DUF1501 domain-containing protein, partial [Planctomycetota bacterium]